MSCKVSVIICTHNPRSDYLKRTLDALQSQTLPKEQWELLLVDNASREPMSKSWDLSWHPCARHIREEELGLTRARLSGIKNSQGKLLVFVDDDNVLDRDYLNNCNQISNDFPFLGVWGGQQTGEFEVQPGDFIKPFLWYLACRKVEKPIWANLISCSEATPVGAGMCIRKEIAGKYLDTVDSSHLSKKMDRVGNELISCGDHDMAFTACDCGFGMGVFPELRLTHLIPKQRMEKDYILRLMEGDAYSAALLRYSREQQLPNVPMSFPRKVLRKIRQAIRNDFNVHVEDARKRGLKKALAEIQRLTG